MKYWRFLSIWVAACLLIAVTCMRSAFAFDYETNWYVTVTENGVERSLAPTTPDDTTFKFVVDQQLAQGWACEVRPLTWRDNRRWRWLKCQRGGAVAQIRTDCMSDRPSSRRQEMWLGDDVSVQLACTSGVSP
jgi:hypothetical protein